MSDAGYALQQAIFTALNGNLGAGVGVYDHVPQNATYPYVCIDAQEMVEMDFLDSRKDERFVYLSIWSQYRGKKQLYDIIAAAHALLHDKRLPLDVGRIVTCKVKRSHVHLDADGITYQGNMTLRMIIDY